MANNKMLIDASHREETRVVVVRGNRIEEFDFEAQERKQLRGNIYLAKVTRVEPSLQAAFIDYGGNRHGFLAFSEIHPDYYQIPAADRQALLDEEAAQAASQREEDDSDDASSEDAADASAQASDDEGSTEEKPVKRKRRRSRKPKAKAADAEISNADNSDTETGDTESASESDNSVEDGEDDSKTMAAMVETDSISEPAPEDDSSDEPTDNDDAEAVEQPKKRKTRRTSRKKAEPKVEEAEASTGDEVVAEDAKTVDVREAAAEEKPKKRSTRRTSRKKKDESVESVTEVSETDTSAEEVSEGSSETTADAQEKAAEKPRSKRRRSKKKQIEDAPEADENGDPVEAVGQEDALEEVPTRKRSSRQYKIQEVIRRRQVLLVQVVKEERGNKGAALTTYLSLAGRYSVLMPNTARGGGISRKITNPGDRKRLKEIAGQLDVPKGMGVILRTAGASRTNEEITRDFEYLMRLWENVRNLTLESSAPFLVYEEGSLIKRSIRDLYHKDIGEIIVAGEEGFKEAKEFMKMMMPTHTKNVKLHRGEQSILARNGVDAQLDKMLSPQVTLKSGGYLIIDQTEALVAIDVNSGKSTREHSIEATAVQTNLEAAEEVARQLRLRDLAGLVVIDFIDMEEKRNNRAVERKLKECLKNDRARIQVGHISHFGLMEMSRQRIRASVLESTMEVCPHCAGIGHVRSQSSFAIQIVRALEEHLNKNSRNDVTVKVGASACMYILNHKRVALTELEDRFGVQIMIVADAALEGQNYAIEKGNPATREPKQRAAVNPMDFGEETSNDEEAVAETSSANSESSDEEGNNKRRRRKRGGRGRGRDKNTDDGSNSGSNQEKASSTSEVSEPTKEPSEKGEAKAEPVTEDENKEKPKRGRRTSRRGKSAKTEAVPASTETAVEENTQNAKTDATAEEPPRAPRRATGRPGKKATSDEAVAGAEETPVKPVSKKAVKAKPKAKADSDSDSDSEAGEANEPAAKPKRRSTRRVKAVENDAETASEDAPSKEKKKSWWSGGGFFN